jgi:hypothetical protein
MKDFHWAMQKRDSGSRDLHRLFSFKVFHALFFHVVFSFQYINAELQDFTAFHSALDPVSNLRPQSHLMLLHIKLRWSLEMQYQPALPCWPEWRV